MYYVVCPTDLIRTSQLFVVFLEHADLIQVHLNGAAISITLIDSRSSTPPSFIFFNTESRLELFSKNIIN